MKIIHGSMSVLLTGNATMLTTNRALDNYSRHSPKSLQANVLVASQYGSVNQGANASGWIQAVNPEYVLVSHGASRLTFDRKALEIFKSSKRLKNSVTGHEIEIQVPEKETCTTNQGIFSTLKSGTMILDLYRKKLTLRTEREGEITALKATEQLQKKAESLVLVLEGSESLRQTNLSSASVPTRAQGSSSMPSSPLEHRHHTEKGKGKEKETLCSNHSPKVVHKSHSSSSPSLKEMEKVDKRGNNRKDLSRVKEDKDPEKNTKASKAMLEVNLPKVVKSKGEDKKQPSASLETTEEDIYSSSDSNAITEEISYYDSSNPSSSEDS